MVRLILNIVLCLIGCQALAQDTTLQLPTAMIVDSFNRSFSNYNRAYFTDENSSVLGINGPVSESLVYSASGNTRSNGPGKVTTFSKHGLPAEHTRVYWNNIELNSPLNGIVDLSTLPSFLLSRHSDLFNQEDVKIRFSSDKTHAPGTYVLFNTGAFEQIHAGIKQGMAFGKSTVQLGGEYTKSKNDFNYLNDLNQTVRQVHGDYEQLHGTIDLKARLTPSAQFNLSALYSDIKTNIPPTLFQKSSRARQANYPFKLSTSLVKDFNNSKLNLGYGAIIETLKYENSDLRLDVKHKFWRNKLDMKWQKFLRHNASFQIALNETYEVGKSDNFSKRHANLITDAEIGLSKVWRNNLIFSPTLGIIYGRDILSPIQFAAKLTYIIDKKNRLRTSAQSLYRMPTYNELYWSPGGNLNLSPESGMAFVLDYFHSGRTTQFELGTSLHRISNRILWLPNNLGIFSPVNVGHIGSEEIHAGVNVRAAIKTIDIRAGIRYTYLNAKIIKSESGNFQKGKKLPFTPIHALSQHVILTWKNRINLKLNGKYQSRAFTNTDNSGYLPHFYLLQSKMEYRTNIHRHPLLFFISINNLTNATYQLSNGYPQPPRHWLAGFTLQFKQKT